MAIDQGRGMRVIRRQHHDRLAILAGANIRGGLALDGRLKGHSKLRTRGRRSPRDETRKPAPDRRRSRPPPQSHRWWARRPGSAGGRPRGGGFAVFDRVPPPPETSRNTGFGRNTPAAAKAPPPTTVCPLPP